MLHLLWRIKSSWILKNEEEHYIWYLSPEKRGMIYFWCTEVYYWIFQNSVSSLRTIVLHWQLQLWKQFSNSFIKEDSFSKANEVVKKIVLCISLKYLEKRTKKCRTYIRKHYVYHTKSLRAHLCTIKTLIPNNLKG